MFCLAVFLALNLSVHVLIGVAIYGDLRTFRAALSAWRRELFSLRIIYGSIFPPLRLQLWLYLCIAASWGACALLVG
jgi:hypothetical protein